MISFLVHAVLLWFAFGVFGALFMMAAFKNLNIKKDVLVLVAIVFCGPLIIYTIAKELIKGNKRLKSEAKGYS